jgi:glucose/arabinose dehydrogenase
MRRLVALLAACGGTPAPAPGDLALETVATGLQQPLAVEQPPGEQRLFVAEKIGRVAIVEGGARARTFLDIASLVSTGSEQGLLGLAFHPGYESNRRFFVHYTDRSGDTRVVEYRAATADAADPASAVPILAAEQPFANHNGGQIAFGPDGMLYIALGDGGSGFDPQDHGQRLDTLLGKILRIDVDGARPYEVPPDNPFQDAIWHYGLRNPWRFSFDRDTGDLWIADVGQQEWEEIDVARAGEKGLNFGWNVVEGNQHCPRAPDQTCTLEGSTAPVHDYDHDIGNAVVGGFVYRGSRIPALRGSYLYGDNGSGVVRSIRWQGSFVPMEAAVEHPELLTPGLASFGEERDGELIVCSLTRGSCSRIVPTE